jgi:hypothetical protein
MPKLPDGDAILAQFNLLMGAVLGSGVRRSNYQPWEIEILLDIESCRLHGIDKRKVLSEYHNVVQAELEDGAQLPIRFAEYLARREQSRMQRKPANRVARTSAKPGAQGRY